MKLKQLRIVSTTYINAFDEKCTAYHVEEFVTPTTQGKGPKVATWAELDVQFKNDAEARDFVRKHSVKDILGVVQVFPSTEVPT